MTARDLYDSLTSDVIETLIALLACNTAFLAVLGIAACLT